MKAAKQRPSPRQEQLSRCALRLSSKELSVIPMGDGSIGNQSDGSVARLSVAKSVALPMTPNEPSSTLKLKRKRNDTVSEKEREMDNIVIINGVVTTARSLELSRALAALAKGK